MPTNLLDELLAKLKSLSKKEQNEFMRQLLAEKTLYDQLKSSGFEPSATDITEKSRVRPKGILSLVEKIDYIALIELINKISEITTIKTLETLQTLQTIQTVNQIDNITTLNTINTINTIKNIEDLSITPYYGIINPSFSKGTMGWRFFNAELDGNTYYTYPYCAKITGVGNYISQTLYQPIPAELVKGLSFIGAVTDTTLQASIRFKYNNMTSAVFYHYFSNVDTWEPVEIEYKTAGKNIIAIDIGIQSGSGILRVDDVCLLFKTSPREDTVIKAFDLAFTASGTSEIIAGVAYKKVKVYSYGYESDANVEVGFQFGTGELWGRRVTSGVLVHEKAIPFVSADGEALNFYAGGAVNVKGFVQYIQEA